MCCSASSSPCRWCRPPCTGRWPRSPPRSSPPETVTPEHPSGYQLSSTLGGGFAPLIAATLVAGTTAGNGLFRVALFAAAAALISAITISIAKESSKRNLVAAS